MRVQQITPNFKDYEFACKDGTLVPDQFRPYMELLAAQLEIIRYALNERVYINSAYRTITHNANVGGASRSYHLKCMAADIHCQSATPSQVFAQIKRLMDTNQIIHGGLKQYGTFVHYDIRGTITLFK